MRGTNAAPQLELFPVATPDRPPVPPRPVLDIVKSEPKPIPAPVPPAPRREDVSFNGYVNSATYSASLSLTNDPRAYEAFRKLWLAGKLDEQAVKRQFGTFGMTIDSWAEGQVNWPEIIEEFVTIFREEVEMTPIALDALTVLSCARINGTLLELTVGQLDRKLYESVDRILVAMGGKWNKKLRAHVFQEDPTEALESVLLTGTVKKPEKYGFFPTPQPLAQAVAAMARIQEGMRVLEPEAGDGNLADEAAKLAGGKVFVTCYELQEKNCSILRDKGYTVTQCDFLTLPEEGMPLFDVVLMNPPFEKQGDILHVLKAWNFVRPGGNLTSIMSPGFTFRSDRRSLEFRQFVEEYGYYVENPDGSFKPSGTNVRTVTISLDKP